MSDTKISALTAADAAAGANEIPINEAGTNKKITVTQIANAIALDSTVPVMNNSLYRQALINGNFNVWQRGVTLAVTIDAGQQFMADRWGDYGNDDGGTAPTLTRTKETLTAGDIPGAFYYSRLTTNGAGTSLGDASRYRYAQNIEHMTRFLCGNGKKVTVSFYARSSIANKKICPVLGQNYGSGGSPTAIEYIVGTTITLTSSWVKYTQTITTNTLAGKTFGTANDDYCQIAFVSQWGDTNAYGIDGVETFGGSGTLDIAQVQLCAGDVALPFMPKSYDDELRACQRYCYAATGGGSNFAVANGHCIATTDLYALLKLPVTMRTTPTLTVTATDWSVSDGQTVTAATGVALVASRSGSDAVMIAVTTGATLTQYRPAYLESESATKLLILSAEL